MITRLTKIQLIIFAFITVIGGAFVGARYAQIDRLVIDRTYTVTLEMERSGSIFENAEVTYRGVGVGRVGELRFTPDGVEVDLKIENSAPNIPADTLAVVANKSAVGEQFVDLQPRHDGEPYLQNGDRITAQNTRVPIETHEVIINVADLLSSIDAENLNIMVTELGAAFEGTGDDLALIADTSMEFINAAADNLDLTRQLIRNSQTVLQTQIDSGDAIRDFSANLRLFTDELVSADGDLRRLVDVGPAAARNLSDVVAENHDDLTQILNELRVANYPLSANVDGLRGMLILFPLIVEGAFTVASPDSSGDYWGHFGLVAPVKIGDGGPALSDAQVCREGYTIHDQFSEDRFPLARGPHERAERPVEIDSDCTNEDPNVEGTVPRKPRNAIIDGRNAYDIPPMPRTTLGDPAYDGRGVAQGEDWLQWLEEVAGTRE